MIVSEQKRSFWAHRNTDSLDLLDLLDRWNNMSKGLETHIF